MNKEAMSAIPKEVFKSGELNKFKLLNMFSKFMKIRERKKEKKKGPTWAYEDRRGNVAA